MLTPEITGQAVDLSAYETCERCGSANFMCGQCAHDDYIFPNGAEMLRFYSAALDEIHQLRAALAYEAMQHRGSLELKTLPKSVRTTASAAVHRMERAARGATRGQQYSQDDRYRPQALLKDAGASGLLTRSMWEQEVDRSVSAGSGTSGVTR